MKLFFIQRQQVRMLNEAGLTGFSLPRKEPFTVMSF